MEEDIVCRFCLKMLVNQNFNIVGDVTLEILKILSIEIDLSINEKSLMCRNCQDTIDRCFNFKSTCISSEDSIAEYITEDSKLDLEEFYLTVKLKNIPKGHKICRLCMKIATTSHYLNTTDELFALTSDKLRKCIPEFNLYLVKQPVICEACLVGLQNYYEFITCCLDVEKKINKYCEARGVDKRQVQLYNVLQFILNETLKSDISKCAVAKNTGKLDKDQLNNKINCSGLSAVQFRDNIGEIEIKTEDEIKSSSNKRINGDSETGVIYGGPVQCPEADQTRRIKEENDDDNQLQVSTKHGIKEGSVCIKNEEIEIKSGDANMSYTKDCETQEKTLLRVKACKKKYTEDRPIKSKAFFCEKCSTNFASKYTLQRHKLLKHVEHPLVRIFGCNKCSFVTEYRESLRSHRKVHRNRSESYMHKCKECEFRTKYKRNLKAHSLARHQSSEILIPNKLMLANPEVKIYSCGLCDYKTKFKRHLAYHAMTHKDKSELATYDCFHCSYKGKRKSHLRTHMKVHETMRELRKYKSKTCDFISKDVSCVTSDKDQADVYSCDKSNFIKSPDSSLKNDMLTQIFKCEICLYQATSSTELKQHSFTHPEVKQADSMAYNCRHCSYQTTHKKYLKMHLFLHNDKSLGELSSLKCLLCSYQTVRKKNLERHVQSHRKGSAKELWNCKVCGGEYSKFHVTKHQRICVGQGDVTPDSYNGDGTDKKTV